MDLKDLSKIDINQLLKNKNILTNIGIIILALFVTVNMHKGQAKKINLLKNKISQENEISVSLGEVESLEEKVNKIKGNLPKDLSSDIVIERISSIANKRNIRISSIDSQTALDREMYQLLPVRLEIKTGYHNLGHFISDIEQTGIFRVKALNVRGEKTYSGKISETNFVLELFAITLKK